MEGERVESRLQESLVAKAAVVNRCLEEVMANRPRIRKSLGEAMRYTLSSPGKRIRGALVLWCCEMFAGVVNEDAKAAASAVELVHTYSLVHDDLPAMDDDDLRRGRASCHKEFDEATAILTGDALLTLAFEVLAEDVGRALAAVRMIKTLANVCGAEGMIGGQMADMESANTAGTEALLREIHVNKTARMFAGAAAMGAIAGGADDEAVGKLLEYGLKLGLCFQVSDDILDVSGTSEELGKTAGKDAQQGKMTYPKLLGMEGAKKRAKELTSEAVAALEGFGEEASILRELAETLKERSR
jgi:geranylgeranyl pyrophosphate synthase